MLAALIVIDVSTQIGEYHSAVKKSPKWSHDARAACKAINIVALRVVTVGMIIVVFSALIVTRLTMGMDSRMVLVLEGISRLEAAYLMAYLSVKTPRWIGVYHSPEKHRYIQHVGEGIESLKFNVRYSIGQYFALVYCLMLPFTGRPISALLGFSVGFIIEWLIVFARKGDEKRCMRVASPVAMVFGFLASVMFADGCHYIQVVWGSGLWRNSEWGLGIATFFAASAAILSSHLFQLQRTVKMTAMKRRISTHDKEERLATSLICSHLFGSNALSQSQQAVLKKEMEQSQNDNEEDKSNTTQTVWSLFKERMFTRSDLVMFSRFEYCIGVLVSVASLFVVIVNIGATKQMDTVRKNFHKVHDTLYGHMDQGPVCGFNKIGGAVSTFESSDAARSAGYKVGHCGACGQCSTWQDLRLQYTTRKYLAKESARCAKKSLIYGRDAVHDCLQEEPIGFSDKCAECWTEDIICARSHCAFIFLQSNMINTVSNFQVSEDIITSATCEEAMCELAFVPCSGANRRRMNITSTIARPGQQQCSILDVNWENVFGENNPKTVTMIKDPSVGGENDEL